MASIVAESPVEGMVNSGEYALFPAIAHVPRIHRQDVHLISLVNGQLVLSALVVFTVSVDSEVLNQQSVRKREIRIPQPDLSTIQDGSWFLIREGQAILVEQMPDSMLPQRLVGGIPSTRVLWLCK